MSYQIKVGNKKLKDTFYTLAPVNGILKIFVLNNVKREQNKLVQCWSATGTSTVLAVMLIVNIFFLFIKVQRFEGGESGEIRFSDTLQLMYMIGFVEYIVDLIFVYKMRNSCVKYLQFYANIDKILGAPNFSRIRMDNFSNVVLFIIWMSALSIFDFTAWTFAYGWTEPVLYSLDYVYSFINALSILDVISNVIQIEYRVRLILGYIEDYYSSSSTLSPGMDLEFETVGNGRMDRLKTISFGKGFDVLSLSKCYVMLMEQVNFINAAYGVRIGVYCLNVLIYLVYLINIIIRMALGQFKIAYPAYYMTVFSTVFRTAHYAITLSALMYRCEQTYKLCNGIVRLVDLTVVNKKIPNEMKTALLDLRALVLSRGVRFHGAGFFGLDYPLLVSVASAVVTYSIILLQSMR